MKNKISREELKRWFIQQEVDLFRYKLTKINTTDTAIIENFLKENDLHYSPVSGFLNKYISFLIYIIFI